MLSDSNHILLGDFGLSRYMSEATLEAYSKVGTPLYISPEVLSGSGYSYSTDVWSLGCCVYELCTLRSPFKPTTTLAANDENEKNLNLFALFQNIKSGQYMPVQQASTQHAYSTDLYALIDAMLHLVPERRPSMEMIMRYSASKCKDPTKLKPTPTFNLERMDLADVVYTQAHDENAGATPMQVNTLQRRSMQQQPAQTLQKRVTSPSVNNLLERQHQREHRSNVQLQSTVVPNAVPSTMLTTATAAATVSQPPKQPAAAQTAAKANINAARLPVGSPGRPLTVVELPAAVAAPAPNNTPVVPAKQPALEVASTPAVSNPYSLVLEQTTRLIYVLSLLRYTSTYCLRFHLPPLTSHTFLTATSQTLYRTFTATLLWLTEQFVEEHIALRDLSTHVQQYSPLPLIMQTFQVIVSLSAHAEVPNVQRAIQHLQQQQTLRVSPTTTTAMLEVLGWLSSNVVHHRALFVEDRLLPRQPAAEDESDEQGVIDIEEDMQDASADDALQLDASHIAETQVIDTGPPAARPLVSSEQWLTTWPEHMAQDQLTLLRSSMNSPLASYHIHNELLAKQRRRLTTWAMESEIDVTSLTPLASTLQRITTTQQHLSQRYAALTQHAHSMQRRLSELQEAQSTKRSQLEELEVNATAEADNHTRLKRLIEQERGRQADDAPLRALQASVSQVQLELRRSLGVRHGVKQVLWHQSMSALTRSRARASANAAAGQ